MKASGSAIPQWRIDASRFAILSRLAADLVHGIKNPLNSMVINLHVLETRLAKGDAAAVRERATVIEHEIRRLNTLIELLSGLLRSDRDSAGPTSVARVLDDLSLLVGLRTGDAHLDFNVDNLTADAFTPTPAHALRFALLAAAELVFDLARKADTPMWLTAEQHPAEIHIRIGFAGDPFALQSAAEPAERSGYLTGIEATAALLEPSGGSVEIEIAGPAVLVRLARSV